ncbi:MAG: 2-hydroxyacyl-CoA dehydratase [Flavobacteriales bacterium]|nr:2-hydroxyacyl-CoA dehydratase [Flavobacteriales bacterium]MCW8911858.1 2-hydroxyacyl-CoA dehydratase [Flavobacteriales bacterium]MCW8936371.1 2-hydroxyacyl-CoA dehydratase [Flavobacteriales bacterium]MCW8939659.1 2-hydroxyacyl-CoA dehydratase [Flavobacteriales bacterium]MCW8969519.1 2-hydroxyacyl-CoA dehydratase [Flavobacteriales bacterium]
MKNLKQIINDCKELAFDLNFTRAKKWKAEKDGRVIVGYTPIYFPREVIHAAGGLPVGVFGGGDRKQIIKGDAYYQSYICHIPRSIMELALDKHLDDFDGFIFPSICDVLRNLSGIFKQHKFGKFVKYMDFPQNFLPQIGGVFYQQEMEHVMKYIKEINGKTPTVEELNHSIGLYNKNRQMIEFIYDIRQEFPWRLSIEDVYHIVRAGTVIPVEEHNEILEQVCIHIKESIGEPQDKIKVVISGAFCEQPAVGLIRAIEEAGCYVVDDDYMLGSRMILGDIDATTNKPLEAISNAYIKQSQYSSSIYDVDNPKEYRLAKIVEKRGANGVIFASASFCDPSLLDAPIFQNAFNKMGIRYIAFQFSENINQFKVIKEQVGAFSDSIKLWEDEPVLVTK